MKAVEAVKEKFYCFLGIVHPTYYQSKGWGPWLNDQASSAWIHFLRDGPSLKMVLVAETSR